MAISKDEIAMLNPTSDGGNYGIPVNWGQKNPGNAPTNYTEVMASVTGTTNIDKALGCVTSSGACGQDFTNQLVKNGGIGLGKPLGSDGMAN